MEGPELQLMTLAARGDVSAFEQLYDRYSAALFGVVLKVVNDQARAEEVLQDTFVKIWRSVNSYDPAKGRPFTWMLNIARNTAIDMVRTRDFRENAAIRPLDAHVYRTGSDPLTATTDHIGMDKVLGGMPVEQREMIDLAYYQGYSQQEIADRTGLPLGTVKSRTRAALSHLRTALKDHR
jgi:RNA polymerase sigma factor (sigma-70 family)